MQVNLNIPTTWNELSATQLKNITEQLETYQHLIKTFPSRVKEFDVKLHLQLSKELLRGNKYRNIRIALDEIPPKEFIQHTKFIFKGIERTKFLPTIQLNKKIYYAPAIRFRNASIAEFAFVDAVWYKWRISQKEIWLNVLVAALYREHRLSTYKQWVNKHFIKETFIDVRQDFQRQLVDARADQFKQIDYTTKLAIAYTYEGCRNHIQNTYPNIFPKSEPTKKQKKNKTFPKYQGFSEIILDKIKGDPSKLASTNKILVYDFLNIVEKDIKDFNSRPKQ